MKTLVVTVLILQTIILGHALVINEIMSNPTGDDSGREWIELYNNSESSIDLIGLTVSIKGGSLIPVTPVSGGTSLPALGYAIIGSTVTGSTKFLQDYPTYNGVLLKSAISLVNTGVTSVELKVSGSSLDTVPSYTAAKEGSTYSLIDDGFESGIPTPGESNKGQISSSDDATTSPTATQVTIAQMSSPSADIVLYLPGEKTVIAGAPSTFSVYSLTHGGKPIDFMTYLWSFGDGGSRMGSTTIYRYFYPGRYVAHVEGSNGLVAGVARMNVRVVPPDIFLSKIATGKYGAFIDVTNPNSYDLDISGWKLSIDGALFSFPQNTIIARGVTHISGVSMGFASTTVSSTTLIKLLFPSMDEVLRVYQTDIAEVAREDASRPFAKEKKNATYTYAHVNVLPKSVQIVKSVSLTSTPKNVFGTTTSVKPLQKDTRVAGFLKSLLFSK